MSAILAGYDGPLLHSSDALDALVEYLNKVYEKVAPLSLVKFETVGDVLQGLREVGEHVTQDGYVWSAGLVFDVSGGRIIVLFPQHEDISTRSISIYKVGDMELGQITDLIDWLAIALRVLFA